jgi:hypothetical protein
METKMFQRPAVRSFWWLAVAVFGSVVLSACQFDWHTLQYAKTKPDPKEIIGSWVATESTLRELSRTAYSAARPTVVLADDATIRMKDIPDAWRDPFGDGHGRLETFSGTWRFYEQQGWWGLQVTGEDWQGGCGGCIMVLGQKAPYRLRIIVGDPDRGVGYEFRRAG